jgi:hypothetical protein
VIDASLISRGTILHHYSTRAGKTKWFVVLNALLPDPNGVLIYAFFTSQVERFERARVNPAHIVRLEPGSYPMCRVPTIIDLTDIIVESFEGLVAGDLKVAGQLTPAHLAEIDAAVRCSTVITARQKKGILAGYG